MPKFVKLATMDESESLFIPDASVMLKWFFMDEKDGVQEAVSLQKDYLEKIISMIIPHYALAEMLNTFGRELSIKDAGLLFSFLVLLKMNEYPITIESASLSCGLMQKYKVSFYDAGYHALAIQEGGTFLTADEKYYQKTKKEGSVMLLSDYGKKR